MIMKIIIISPLAYVGPKLKGVGRGGQDTNLTSYFFHEVATH